MLVPLIVAEPATQRIERWLLERAEPLLTGRLAVAEASAALSRKRRMDELDKEEHARALATLDAWIDAATTLIDHDAQDVRDAITLVRRATPKLLAPDAIHLATSRRLGTVLVMSDAGLALAAGAIDAAHVLI